MSHKYDIIWAGVAGDDLKEIMTSTRGGGMKNREPLKAD